MTLAREALAFIENGRALSRHVQSRILDRHGELASHDTKSIGVFFREGVPTLDVQHTKHPSTDENGNS